MRILIWAVTAGLGFLGGWLLVPTDDPPPVTPAPPSFEDRSVGEGFSPEATAPDDGTEHGGDVENGDVENGDLEEGAEANKGNDASEEPTIEQTDLASIPADESLAALLDRYPALEYETGEGVITGIALDPRGNPVEGVDLTLIVHGTTPGVEQRGIESPTLFDYIREEIDQYHFDVAFMRHATSGADGTFRFEKLSPDWQYHVHPDLDLDRFVHFEGKRQQLSPGAELTARVFPGAWLDCDIVDYRGEPVRPAWLQFLVEIEGERVRTAVPYGHTSPPQVVPTLLFEAQAVSQNRERSEARDLAFEEGEQAQLKLVVKGRPSLTVFPEGSSDPIDFMGLQVSVLNEEDLEQLAEMESEEYSEMIRYMGRTRLTLRPGRPSSTRLDAGSYRLLLFRAGEILDEQDVRIADGPAETSIAIPPLDRNGLYEVSVLSSSGAPVDDVRFQVHFEYDDPKYGGVGNGSTGTLESTPLAPGRFAVLWKPTSDSYASAQNINATLHCTHDELGSASTPIGSAQGGEFAITFETPAFVRIELEGYVGHDLQGRANVSLQSVVGETGGHLNLDPQGFATAGPLRPGLYKVFIGVQNRYYGSQSVEQETVELASGRNELFLPLPVFHSVTIRFPDGEPGTQVWLQTAGSYMSSSTIGTDGIAVFDDLREGTYEVMAGRGRQAMMSITVPTAGELVFTPTQLDALGVTIFDQEGWLATAGFQSGDKIVSLDGESFDNVRSLQFALMRALSARGGEIEVQRGGALVSIPIRAGEVTDFSDLGGMLEPTSRGGGQ